MATRLTWKGWGIGNGRRRVLPVLVWLIAVGASGWLIAHRAAQADLVGIANPERREVAALTDGRLRLMPVALFDPVKAGQPLVVLEDDRLQAALATAAAEATRLRAELAVAEKRLPAETVGEEIKYATEARRYAIDVERYRLHELELQVTIETERARLDFLRTRRDLFDKLRGQRAVSELGFKSAEADLGSLEKSLEENAKTLAQTRADLEQARQRREQFAQCHVVPLALDQALEPLRAAVTVQERLIDELSLEHTMLVLKSPMDGVVSQILRGVGESVRTGEPILIVVSTRPAEVIAYIAPAQVSRFAAGVAVRLETMRAGVQQHTVDSRIQAVGPQVEQIPARLWRNPAIPEWGWPVKIMVPTELEILCGETVGVIGLRHGLSEDTSGIPASKSM